MGRTKHRKIKVVLLLLATYTTVINCTKDQLPVPKASITLRWVIGHENQTIAELEEGLKWSLSFLGATLPPGSFRQNLRYLTPERFELSLSGLGFTDKALAAFQVIIDRLEASEEFERFGAIDAGRFIVLTLHSSWHYYRIVDSPVSLKAFLGRYPTTGNLLFPILESSVAKKSRVIQFDVGSEPLQLAYVAEETEVTNFAPGQNYPILHYETLDVMPNGQLRFAIYDAEGFLIPAAPARQTRAGKPSKCLWCHETNVQPLFSPTPDIEHFMPATEFQSWIDSSNLLINRWRKSLKSDLDFEQQPNHTFSELLYITFMEPTLMRVANEWEVRAEEIRHLLEDLDTHDHDEFSYLRNLYDRNAIDAVAPYSIVPVPADVREPNVREPNFF